ncbi:hypothetical protein C0993_012774, partial [Termitomyces sp. T159_Od127]
WAEIEKALLKEPAVNGKKQTASDQLDIVARVFELKKNALLKEIKDGLFCHDLLPTPRFRPGSRTPNPPKPPP